MNANLLHAVTVDVKMEGPPINANVNRDGGGNTVNLVSMFFIIKGYDGMHLRIS